MIIVTELLMWGQPMVVCIGVQLERAQAYMKKIMCLQYKVRWADFWGHILHLTYF
jgi:hypothetical protein